MIRIGEFIPVFMSLILLSVAAVSDLKSSRIPNPCICVGLAAGILCRTLSLTSFGWGGFFFGILIPFLICWIPFRMGAMGAGDVKLLIALGALNGGQEIFWCIFFSFLFAAGISLGRLLSLRQLRYSLIQLFFYFQSLFFTGKPGPYEGRDAKGHTIHFAVPVFLGYVVWLGVNVCRVLL